MRSETAPVYLKEPTGQVVAARLLREAPLPAVEEAAAAWRPFVQERLRELEAAGVPRSEWPQHQHWNWEQKADRYGLQRSYRFLGIECEGEMQAMMLVDLDTQRCRVTEQRGEPLVYIEYLSAAPWNLLAFVATPRYKGTGTLLIQAAIEASLDLEYQGRIGLHSLPQADRFYLGCGMTDLGPDEAYYGLRYFEMTPQQAERYLT